jgi:hypothetical protein
MGAQTVFVACLPGVGLGDVQERALADVFQHQPHLDDEQDRVEGDEARQRDQQLGRATGG